MTDEKSDERLGVEAQAILTGGPVTPLTMPCTALQLRQWVQTLDAIRPGSNTAALAASATSITVT